MPAFALPIVTLPGGGLADVASGPVMQWLVAIAFAVVLVLVIVWSVRGYRAQSGGGTRRRPGDDDDPRRPRG